MKYIINNLSFKLNKKESRFICRETKRHCYLHSLGEASYGFVTIISSKIKLWIMTLLFEGLQAEIYVMRDEVSHNVIEGIGPTTSKGSFC